MTLRFAVFSLLAATSISSFAQDGSQATYDTADGKLTVRSSQPGPQSAGPAPAFSSLDGSGKGFVTADEAAAYPLLANDFIHADSNRDGKVSKAEYARWSNAR
ncbi:MAG: hypothetical protein ABIR62_03415 [Dokdonella sp.]|uniref:hypothetical protein n=1 Tax=Dokdonella sp. TaxID=2291710 RepID=UPI003267D240